MGKDSQWRPVRESGGAFPGGTGGKEPTCQCRRHKRCGFSPWVGKILWSRTWEPTAVCLPGEPSWTEEPGGYSPWGCREDPAEVMSTHTREGVADREGEAGQQRCELWGVARQQL